MLTAFIKEEILKITEHVISLLVKQQKISRARIGKSFMARRENSLMGPEESLMNIKHLYQFK